MLRNAVRAHPCAHMCGAAVNGNVKYMKRLLQSGVPVNRLNGSRGNILVFYINYCTGSDFKPEIALLLYAAGEAIDTHDVDTPDCIKETDDALNLKLLCINSIRNHLLNLDVHGNLFCRVPYLPLPTMLKNNLLFDVLVSRRDSGEYGEETAV